MKKRTTIRIISFLAAATVALGAASVIFYRRAVTAEREERHRGEYAFSELCAAADGLSAALEKSQYAVSPAITASLCAEVYSRAQTASAALSSLSVPLMELENTASFFARTGDYALWLLRESSGGDDVSEEARENLRALGDTAALLSGNLAQLRSDVAGGLVSTRAAAAMDDALPTLGDSFLENIQGLTTLKIYQADGWKHEQMNAQAERFRRITMKVLTMQLNSVTLMDLMAYGGAGLGIISAVAAFAAGRLTLTATLTIVLLAADFFLPLRLLGSYFHIAMNGAASAEKIFKLLAAEEPADGDRVPGENTTLKLEHVTFGYEKDRTILNDVSFTIPQGSFVSLVGESGCGKSTIAALLSGSRTGYTGSVTLGGVPVQELQQEQRLRTLTLVPHNAAIFKGTVESNLRMAKSDADEAQLWAALEQVNLADFCRSQNGLQTALHEGGSNLSGGQRQRLAMARALLHDTPIYLFDEATSNVDAESENDIMQAIHSLAGKKTIILISHRLANVVHSDCIYAMSNGRVIEQGTHAELLAKQGAYSRLYLAQRQLETLEEEDA